MTNLGTENLEVMEEAIRYNAFLASLIRRTAAPGSRVLDFGAGFGTFAKMMQGEGYAVVCVEPSQDAYVHLKDDLNIEVYTAIESVPPLSVDGAYSLNVLEHVENDLSTLKAIYERVRQEGTLVLYVPAFQILFSTMDRRVGHLRRYRKSGLKALVESAGFAVRRAEYVDSLGFFATLAYRMAGNSDGTINRSALKFYDRFLFPISRVFDLACGRFFGKNLLIEAVRP